MSQTDLIPPGLPDSNLNITYQSSPKMTTRRHLTHKAKPTEGGTLLRFSEVAARLNIGSRTLRRLIADEKFPDADISVGTRLRRWTPENVEAGIDRLKGEM